jgi:hypothetical protein
MKNVKKSYHIYGIVGMVGLFLMGLIVGFILNGSDHVNHSTMTESQCNSLAGQIMYAANTNSPELIEQLNKVYSENCLNRVFEQPKPQPKLEEHKLPKVPDTTCGKIEYVLLDKLQCSDETAYCPDSETHVYNAKIYANLSERGCPENSEKYKMLAKQELEIARALNDDNVEDEEESVEIVETYKRLQMQAEAERMIEKAKKLTNPAIDFIIQLEKIIEE